MQLTLDRLDYDGFYGEPAPFDPSLEVEIHIEIEPPAQVVAPVSVRFARGTARVEPLVEKLPHPISVVVLDDDWFGNFDENAEVHAEYERIPTTRWQKLGEWLRALGRAA